ncbi:glutathione S-transferase family protein [Parvularcula oceani]|uniref:glutathione S-transferase family protein n=1 Tax=Parvularcula oceani TaxID=1247963 RepID=UPI000689F7B4|nr:glutathione S-transferase N-terminal domain-containing protein [Parvularcula oceani]
MKLYGSLTSPYVRLCRLAAERRGLSDRITLVQTDPYKDRAFRRVNPFAKVPALVLDDGTALYDSGVILRYLDTLGGTPSLYEVPPYPRHVADSYVALATGTLDVGVAWLLEDRRPEGERSGSWQSRRLAGVEAGLEAMAEAEARLPESAGLVDIAFAVTLDWLAFRLPSVEWQRHEGLAQRAGRLLATAPFAATDPRKG